MNFDLRDASVVGLADEEIEAVRRQRSADFGHSAEARDDEAAERVVVAVVR